MVMYSRKDNRRQPLLKIKDYQLLLSPHNAWSAQESIDNLVQAS
ncbi:MAG: hypothetical protein ACLUZZ_04580 [Alistipes inops]